MNLNNYMPKLSIIIPTYNRSNYLEQSLKSIFDQDFKDFEIIVVDNNSTDFTKDVIDKFSKDERLKYFKNDHNLGASNNHIKALQLASGEYISMFSDDDIMLQDSLKIRIDVLDAFDDIVLVHSSFSTIDEKNNLIQRGHWAKNLYDEMNIETGLMNSKTVKSILIKRWNFICMPTVIVRSSIIHKHFLTFNNTLNYFIDWDFWLRLLEYGSFYYVNEELINYRRHSVNETNKIKPAIALTELFLLKLSYYNKYNPGQLNRKFIFDLLNETSIQVDKVYGLKNGKKNILSLFFKKLLLLIKFR